MLRDFMHAAASIPVGAVVSLLFISIATGVTISAVINIIRGGPVDEDVTSLEEYRQHRDALRHLGR